MRNPILPLILLIVFSGGCSLAFSPIVIFFYVEYGAPYGKDIALDVSWLLGFLIAIFALIFVIRLKRIKSEIDAKNLEAKARSQGIQTFLAVTLILLSAFAVGFAVYMRNLLFVEAENITLLEVSIVWVSLLDALLLVWAGWAWLNSLRS